MKHIMLSSSQYATTLPNFFHSTVSPQQAPNPKLVALNEPLAKALGLDITWLRSPEGLAFLCQGKTATNTPVAMAYAGHQFGHFVPSLGDGRALLAGDCTTCDGHSVEIHIKGAGLTPFSRGGDGKNTLGPALREYLVSEAMAALNIPTTRALAVLTTGEMVERDQGAVPGAILVRTARSHIRVGHFQYAAAHGGIDYVRTLADFTIQRLYPSLTTHGPERFLEFFKEVVSRHAKLTAQWMGVGFIHGVMNTDNCALSGETLDYGPCAFMDKFDPMKHFSFIDQQGRYAYGRQPAMALWNLSRLAECLFPLFHPDEDKAIALAEDALHGFDPQFHHQWLLIFRQKLGLETEDEHDIRLLEHILETMHTGSADFTNSFRALGSTQSALHGDYRAVRELFPTNKGHFDLCRTELLHRLTQETRSPIKRQTAMNSVNPLIIPRNHRIEEVISHALQEDYRPFLRLHSALQSPFALTEAESAASAELDPLTAPPTAEQEVQHTFCGT